jgi:hypothetical protein
LKLTTAAVLFALFTAAAPAAAAPAKMTGEEIKAALTGNSVAGVWGSTPYVSSFDASGGTVYTAQGRAPAQGRWSVKGDQYCSTWEQTGESCYDLERDGDTIIWIVPETGARYLSALIKGQP